MLIGAADIVPGISGGTIALITGVYKELLKSINAISWNSISKFKTEGIKSVWIKLNGPFIIAIFGGIISSILILSRSIEWLMTYEPIGLWSFFLGLILASILFLIKTELQYNTTSLIYILLGAIMSYLLTQLRVISNETPLWYLFISGFIGISAMILPGLSGAYILFIMGVYQTLLTKVRMAQDLLFNFSHDQLIEVTSVLGVFLLGIVIGIKVFARFLTWLLELYPKKSIAVLIGLMVGALNKIWPWQNQLNKNIEETPISMVAVLPQNYDGGDPEIIKSLIFIFIGFVLLLVIEKSKVIFHK